VPSRTCRLGHELIAAPSVGWDRRGAFFLSPIYFRRSEQAMPMHVLRNVCVVHNVDGDVPAFAYAQQGTGNLITVSDRADYTLRSQLDQHVFDLQGEIGRRSAGLRRRWHHLILWRPGIRLKVERLR